MTLRGRFILTGAGALIVFLAVPSLQAQEKEVATAELVRRAELVAVGRVEGLKAQWEGGRSRIVTYVTVKVSEYLKGGTAGPREITVASLGGEIDGVGELYTHTAQFKADEEVVLFAERDRQGRYRVTGGNAGKFTVQKDPATGRALVPTIGSLEDFANQIKSALTVEENQQ